LRRYFSRQGPPKGDAEKKPGEGKDDDEQKDGDFREVRNCFMIFGGSSAYLTAC
jgi:hypothetical protein